MNFCVSGVSYSYTFIIKNTTGNCDVEAFLVSSFVEKQICCLSGAGLMPNGRTIIAHQDCCKCGNRSYFDLRNCGC